GTEATQTGDTGAAAEASTSNNCLVAADNAVIPWKTLGLDETYSVDGWNNRIAYFPAVALLNGVATGWDSLVDDFPPGTTCAKGSNCTACLTRTTDSTSSTRGSFCDPSAGTQNLTPSYPYGTYIPVYSIATTGSTCSVELTQPNTNQTTGAFNGA